MKFVFSAATVTAFVAGVAASNITINTPTGTNSAIQCQAYQVTWTGGTAPYDIRLLDSSQSFVEELGSSVQSSPLVWTVNEASGGSYILTISDAGGNTATTGVFQIETSSSTSCLSSAVSVGAASATGSSASTATGSTSKTSTASTSTTKSSSSTSTTASSSSSSTSSSSTSGASAVSAGIFTPLFAAMLAFLA
ncbi:hypothetical protein K488DRAFT_82397 [Vararia minispora EC-137]|uniref:Uncharacterized protein n=1 Tax=Vararia minispora EC-137 TaxID=1314806 RepID=A0ACB8QW95_9AGAM|nr:hypothetical protein K488DRAFT_82397 [Vararia minispora EC-137]